MTRAFFEVRATPAGPAFVQDLGRPGYLSHAVPRGGALVPELLAAANRAVGNAPDAAALELFGGLDATIHSSFPTPARVPSTARAAAAICSGSCPRSITHTSPKPSLRYAQHSSRTTCSTAAGESETAPAKPLPKRATP